MTGEAAGYRPATGRVSTDVTWVRAQDGSNLSVNVSRLVYPGRGVFWRPGAAVLAPEDDPLNVLAVTPLIHFPNNAPLLLTPSSHLTESVREELARLQPTGRSPRGAALPAQVYVTGPLADEVERAVSTLGLRALRVGGPDPIATAAAVARLRGVITSRKPMDIFIVPAGAVSYWCFAAAYSAHEGVPFLYVSRHDVPAETERYLRTAPRANLYILAGEEQVSRDVEDRLRRMTSGRVTRLAGDTPASSAVAFARFRQAHFGWGRTHPGGHAFTFVAVEQWPAAASGALLAHLGKHSPALLIDSVVPEVVLQYLASVNPP